MKLVIVGAVAGGASAAARARRLSEEAKIVLFERGSDPSFANCGLPYYIGNEITDRGKLVVTSRELLQQRFRLAVHTKKEVLAIDRSQKTVTVRDLLSGQETEHRYDKLILSPGAAPVRPPIPGAGLPGVHTLRNLQDMDRIRAAVDGGARRAVVVGGGFIGLEVAENLIRRGVATTIVERAGQLLPPWDAEMVLPLTDHVHQKGVETFLNQTIEKIESTGMELMVQLDGGVQLQADLVLMSVGVQSENGLAKTAGLDIGPRGGIVVNAHMQTSDPDIYAVGDAVQVDDFVTGESTQIPLAGPANRQGRIAADHIFGRDSKYRGTQGTAILRLFDLTAAMTGLSEKAAQRCGVAYRKVHMHPSQHAGYFPGASPLHLKLLFDPDDGRILGAQVVGKDGVDKRIDVLATAIQARMTVCDLEEVELAYAPPYGSAKDPVNMAGFVAAGVLRGDQPVLYAEDVGQDDLLLDVRTSAEFAQGHIPGAVNIPVDDLRGKLGELTKDRRIVAYCKVGFRGYLATRILLQYGFDAVNLSGGYTTWHMVQATAQEPKNR